MLQNEQVPHKYSEVTANGSSKNLNGDTSLALISSDCELEASFTFEAVTPNVFRTTFTTLKHPLPPHPSARQPEARFGNVVRLVLICAGFWCQGQTDIDIMQIPLWSMDQSPLVHQDFVLTYLQ